MNKSIQAAAAVAGMAAVSPAVADDGSMNYLRTFGPAADPVTALNWGLIAISVAVCIIISFLVLLATLRKRAPLEPDAQGRLPVGPARGGMAWLYIGIAISSVVLFASAVWTVLVLSAVSAPPAGAGLSLEVTGHQWWWEVKYQSAVPSEVFTTANEIHIPVGVPVHVRLVGGDVIHSFWIPQLAGKTDMIPGQTNYAWLQADKPGSYRGQCGEYCGMQHAHMAMHVIAEEPGKFAEWRRAQLADAAVPVATAGATARPEKDAAVANVITAATAATAATASAALTPTTPATPAFLTPADDAAAGGGALYGSQVFMSHCSVCHAVRGTEAHGRLGPDLTHVMSRRMIASGTLVNNRGNLSGWVANAQALKPGSRMPRMDLSPTELHAVVDYLQILR